MLKQYHCLTIVTLRLQGTMMTYRDGSAKFQQSVSIILLSIFKKLPIVKDSLIFFKCKRVHMTKASWCGFSY